jgi:ABC-2 type transport system ATP-binding protein
MFNLINVSKVFKSDLMRQPLVVLNDVSFSVPEGSMVGFLGANGAGKTTSLKIVMDFIRPSSGEVRFSSSLGETRMEILRNIGFLPERPYFYPSLSGEDFLFFMGKLSGMKKVEIRQEIDRWAKRFKIDFALKRELKTYSKGMLQRIGFLATILHKPKLVILDEPLSGLDPIGRKELKDVIIEVHKEGKTVFFSSHIVPDVEEICDRVIFLKDGKLAYQGSVESLLQSSSSMEYSVLVKIVPGGNLSQSSYKQVIDLPGNLKRFTVNESEKEVFLRGVLDSGHSLVSLEPKRLSLEEVFYKTKGLNS